MLFCVLTAGLQNVAVSMFVADQYFSSKYKNCHLLCQPELTESLRLTSTNWSKKMFSFVMDLIILWGAVFKNSEFNAIKMTFNAQQVLIKAITSK